MAWTRDELDSRPATEKQIAYIKALCIRLVLNLAGETKMRFGVGSPERLSVSEASHFINRLLRIERRRTLRLAKELPLRPEPPAPKHKNLPPPQSPPKPKEPAPATRPPNAKVQQAARAAQKAFANFYESERYSEERFKEKTADSDE